MTSSEPKRQWSIKPGLCQGCGTTRIDGYKACFEFGCSGKHAVCSKCFTESLEKIRQSPLLGLVCPCCDEECESFIHGLKESKSVTHSGAEIQREKEKKMYKLGNLKLSEHPVQYHRSRGQDA
jgi:hypothetical protein